MGPQDQYPKLSDLDAAVWVRAFDGAWLKGDWEYLERCLALDVQLRSCDSQTTVIGRTAVLGSIRDFVTSARVHEYNATHLTGRSTGSRGIVRYRWQLEWTSGGERRTSNGKDVLILRAVGDQWQLRARIRRSLDL